MAGAHAGQQCGEGGVGHHEQTRAALAGQFFQTGVEFGGPLEGDGVSFVGGGLGVGVVGGQGDAVGESCQGLFPVRDL